MKCNGCNEEIVQGGSAVIVLQRVFTMRSRAEGRKGTVLCVHCALGVVVKLCRTARAEAQYDVSAAAVQVEPEPVAVLTQAERDATSSYRRWG